jgi:hypothetical protein
VDWLAPSVAFTTPTTGSTIQVIAPGDPIRGTAEDARVFDSGVARIVLTYVDWLGNEVAEAEATCAACPGGQVTWQHVPTVLPGPYTVYARAYDGAGNAASRLQPVFII